MEQLRNKEIKNLLNNHDHLDKILLDGGIKANEIAEKKLREIIRNVIKESWRDSLPIVGIPKMGEEGYQDDLERSKNMAYDRREGEIKRQQDPIEMKKQEDSAYSQKFYAENNIDLGDAYSIANIFMDSKKNKFKISDFAGKKSLIFS